MADDCARIAPRETGVTEKAWAGERQGDERDGQANGFHHADAIADARIATERTKRLDSFKTMKKGSSFPTHRSCYGPMPQRIQIARRGHEVAPHALHGRRIDMRREQHPWHRRLRGATRHSTCRRRHRKPIRRPAWKRPRP